MKKTVWSVLAVGLLTGIACYNFSHTSISQVDLDNMFGGGQCPGTLNCGGTPKPLIPSGGGGGTTWCKGNEYTGCVQTSSGSCSATYSNTEPAYCGKLEEFDGCERIWVTTEDPCTTIPNSVTGIDCAG
ncbi:MAG: hypothetical protein LBJ67_01585 [Planctomycetaceae bacterium]|jgi:hypothetical protein|nr:hypothetical protein [Planctomycetaceae bacterium]